MKKSDGREETPFLSIIIPTFNRPEMLKSCLDLLKDQSFRDFNVIVVDAASSEDINSICRNSGIAEHLRVSSSTFWTGSVNVGIARAVAGNCTHILLLNDDSWYSTDFLKDLVTAAISSGTDIAAPRVVVHETDTVFCDGGLFYEGGPHIYQCNHFLQDRPTLDNSATNFGISADSNCGNGVLFARKVVEKTLPLDDVNCPQYHGDSEYTRRCVAAGFRLLIFPNIELRTEYKSHFKKMGDFGALVIREDSNASEWRKAINIIRRFTLLKNDKSGLLYWPSLRSSISFNKGFSKKILSYTSLIYMTFLAAATEGDEVFHFCRRKQVSILRKRYSSISSKIFWFISSIFEKYVLRDFDAGQLNLESNSGMAAN
jgi:GT2 family glycosyltransferase